MNHSEDKLKAHIQNIFEEQDPSGADRGWLELRKKFPEQKRNPKMLFFWYSGIAASLLIGTFLIFNQDRKAIVEQNAKLKVLKSDSLEHKSANLKIAKNRPHKQYTVKNHAVVVPEKYVQINIRRDTLVTPASQKDSLDHLAQMAAVVEKKPTKVDNRLSFEDFLDKESKTAIASENPAKEKRRIISGLDVFTGTFLNYYADNPVAVNLGGGISASLKLNDQLSFSIGAGISETSISYENSRPSSLSDKVAILPIQNDYGAAKASQITARLLNIDIPIALKFYPSRSKSYYLSGGLNSSTYLNQQYGISYILKPINGDGKDIKKTNAEEVGFQGFDFAHSGIIAIGISRPLGKNNQITFEPFFRPSLRDLGQKNIRVNTAGLNLRLNLTVIK